MSDMALCAAVECTVDDIKQAYKRLSLLCHPDKNSEEGASKAFVCVSDAYVLLSDERKRREHDGE